MHSISMKFCIDLRIHDTFKKQISLSNMLNTIQKESMLLDMESLITSQWNKNM